PAAGALATQGHKQKVAEKPVATVVGRVSGRVVDTAGRSGAGVQGVGRFAGRKTRGGAGARAGGRGLAPAARPRAARGGAPRGADAAADFDLVSDADGKFVLAVEKVGNYTFDARPAPPLIGDRAWSWISKDNAEAVVLLHVFSGSPLRGRVVDAADHGL